MTELAFRQALGRVVERAVVTTIRGLRVMLSLEKFDLFAKRVEEEMSPSLRFSLPASGEEMSYLRDR